MFNLEPKSLILTTMKKAEDDDSVLVRFYEAEGSEAQPKICLFQPIKQAWKTNLIEDVEQPLQVHPDESIQLAFKPLEIVTLKLAM